MPKTYIEKTVEQIMESKPMRFITELHSQMITTRGYPQWKGETVKDVLEKAIKEALTSQAQMMVDIVEGKRKESFHACIGTNCPQFCPNVEYNSALSDILTSYKESGLIK